MPTRKSHTPVRVMSRKAGSDRIHTFHPEPTGEDMLRDITTDASVPLAAQMSAWEFAFSALVLAPMAVTMFFGAAPLFIANAFSRRPVPRGIA